MHVGACLRKKQREPRDNHGGILLVRDDKCLGERVNDLEAAVMLECRTDAKAVSSTECPLHAFAWFVVIDDGTAAGAYRCGIKVERGIVVGFPR